MSRYNYRGNSSRKAERAQKFTSQHRSCSFDRCRLRALIAFALTAVLGSRPVPEHHPGSDQPGHTQVVRVVCMPSEGTARAGQLAPSVVTSGHRRVSRKKENRFRLGLEHPNVGCCSIELILRQNRTEFQGFFGTSRRHLVATSSSSPRLNPHHAAMPASHVPPGSDSVVPRQPLQHNHHAM